MPDPKISVQSSVPPHILFVRQQYTPFGGGELILDRTISALLKQRVKVSLLGRSWNGRKDIEFIKCNPPKFPRFSRERRFATAACELLRGKFVGLVQSHERIPCCDIFRAGDGSHAAFIEHRARGLNVLPALALRLNPYHRSVIALEREMFTGKRLRAVIVNSQMVADEIMRLYSVSREQIHYVPNGIDLQRFSLDARDPHRKEKREELKTGDRPVLLFVGSGYKRKGLGIAIRALAESRTDAELWVVGSDKNPKSYEAMAARSGLSGRLKIFGPVADPLPYYASADALILPTVYDPFPSTVIEAMACGLPVVTSDSCGARDAAGKFDPMLVRDAYDVGGFAEAIRRALDHASKAATVSSVRAIAEEYSIDRMIDRTLGIYQKLATQGGSTN